MAGNDAGSGEPVDGPGVSSGDDRLAVALVRGVHGLHGAVRVEILTDRPEERYAVGSVLHREGSEEPLTVTWSSAVADGPGWRIEFAEIPDRSTAETLKGVYLVAGLPAATGLPRGAYFWHEVVGTTVTSTTGEILGTVRDVYRSGGAEVYIVDGGPYGEFDVPGVRDFVRIFAPRRGEVVIDTEALDLRPVRRGAVGAGKRAPRRRQGSRRDAAARQRLAAAAAGTDG
ncbi:MAG TPA: ribosome maturation factor RimM, partial [Candidatus Limnocylindrales bacterium]|nr:ribosome maturation factor RimM [Candidatus Limnocylindrales bacterium]